MNFYHLFSPIKIGTLDLKNRIVQTAHNTQLESNGHCTERLAHYYAERAKGGVGLIMTGAQRVHPTSFTRSAEIHNYTDEVIPGLKMIAEAVHQHEGKIFGQLSHRGRQTASIYSRIPIVSASPIPCPYIRETPKELEIKEIEEIIQSFGNAARRVKEAGLDGVEMHATHGYLPQQFLSAYSNKRQDEYGGTLQNRMKFVEKITDLIRRTVGRDFPFGIRICGDEFVEGGLTLADTKEIARRIAEKGLVDYISVSVGCYETHHVIVPPSPIPLGSFVYIAAAIKEMVKVPIICSGRINDPVQAEKILENGQADLIGMSRALIADPEWPKKAVKNRVDDIRKCIACNQGCREFFPIRCTCNPEVGREREMAEIPLAKVKKRIMVVGGGPAGLEVARIAAMRGHRVMLYEKKEDLGGQIQLISKTPMREEFSELIRFLKHQVETLGVEVHLGVEIDLNLIKQINPDVIVVATGSLPFKPSIEGIDQPNVVSANDVLEEKVKLGEHIVVVGGKDGHHRPLSISMFLADRGKKVDLLSEIALPGQDIEHDTLNLIYKRLYEQGVNIHQFTNLKRISKRVLTVFNVLTKQEKEILDVDHVVLAFGNRANNELKRSLEGYAKEIYAVGDCLSPRRVPDVVFEASRIGRIL